MNGTKWKQAHGLHGSACLTTQSFLSGIFDGQVNRFKIKHKDFLEGYSINTKSKTTRSWSTDTRLNLKCSRFTRTSLKSFWVTFIPTIPFHFLSCSFCPPPNLEAYAFFLERISLTNFSLISNCSLNGSACSIPLQELYSSTQTANIYLNINSRNSGIKFRKLSFYHFFPLDIVFA